MAPASSIRPVHCPNCGRAFLPPGGNLSQAVQCPNCSRQSVLADCRPAAEPKLEVADRWTMEHEERAEARRLLRRRQSRLVLWLGLGIVAASTVLLAIYLPGLGRHKTEAVKVEKTAEQASSDAEIEMAFEAAKSSLEAPNWESMLPHVRKSGEMRPLMDWYYQHRSGGYQPYRVSGIKSGTLTSKQPATAVLQLETEGGQLLHVVMEQSPDGWKLDWVSFTNFHGVRWHFFLTREADLPDTLTFPVNVQRMPLSLLTPTFFDAAGIKAADTKTALRLFVSNPRTDFAAVVLPENSKIAQDLALPENPDEIRKFTVEVTRKGSDPNLYPPCVEIVRILHTGWDTAAANDK